MGSEVTILGRNPQFLPDEEPEISYLAKQEYQKHMKLHTNHEVIEVEKLKDNKIKVIANNRDSNKKLEIKTDLLLIAAGRDSLSDILHPEKSGIKTDKKGWIVVDKHLETTKPNIWALGDANGKYLFKHAANYEMLVVYSNAFLNRKEEVDYHAIPHAVFSEPEVAGVGLSEKEAIVEYGSDNILIGFNRYQDTGKGLAMAVKDYFVKIILLRENLQILGAHIIGPEASILIQEIINLMYTPSRSILPIRQGMHIHPALTEVVERAAGNLMPVEHYHHYLAQMDLAPE
jgi:dihydrolipoamide dehydrogenase